MCLCSETSIKTQKRGCWECPWVEGHMEVLEGFPLRRMEAPDPFPRPRHIHPLYLAVSEFSFMTNWWASEEGASAAALSSVSCYSKLTELKEGVEGTSDLFMDLWSEAEVTTWTYDWHQKWGGELSCRPEPWNCGIRCSLRLDSIRTELNCRNPAGVAELVKVWKISQSGVKNEVA